MDFEQKLKEVANLREQKGKEQEALDLIARAEIEATNQDAFEILVKLNWERAKFQIRLDEIAAAQKLL